MSKKQITKKQHFNPRFYLKYFADSGGFLQVYDIENSRFGRPRPYAGLGYELFYYANKTGVEDRLSQEVEQWLQYYETMLSQEIVKIIPKIISMDQLDSDDKYILAAFMCLMWLRSPNMRNSINKMRNDLMKQVMSMTVEHNINNFIEDTGNNLTDSEKQDLINTFKDGDYKLRFSNAHHIKMMIENLGFGDKGFTNLFFAKKWKIFLAMGSEKFITTDSPVVEWWPPPEGFYSASFLERKNYFALSPEIFIELSQPKGNDKVNRKTLYEEDKSIVRFKNIIMASHANKYIYSGDKELLKTIVSGRHNSGQVEIEYLKEFELPWREYKKKHPQREFSLS